MNFAVVGKGGGRMIIRTERFGDLEAGEDRIIHFTVGMPGFCHLYRYVLVEQREQLPFRWLQAVDDPGLAFLVIRPEEFLPSYEPPVPEAELQGLGLESLQEAEVYCLVAVPEDPRQMTANLRAPVLINPKNRKARQVILADGGYAIKHRLLEGMLLAAGKAKDEGKPAVESGAVGARVVSR